MPTNDIACVILCAGRGVRMGSAAGNKVCFPIAGTPAINRTLAILSAHHVHRFVLVVGAMAEDVVSTVGQQFPEVLFAYQHEQLGTGHAAQIGVAALRRIGHAGPVLITMGDKVIQPAAIARLQDQFARATADLAFLTAPKRADRTSGRILADEQGQILAIVEARDINRARLLGHFARLAQKSDRLDTARLIELGLEHIHPEARLARALGPLWDLLKQNQHIPAHSLRQQLGPHSGTIAVAGRRFTADQAEQLSPTVNTAVYLFRAEPLYEMITRLSDDNAQREYYLTDLIGLLAEPRDPQGNPRYKLQQVVLDDPHEIQAFNSPDELLAIEDWLRKQRQHPRRRVAPRRAYDRRAFKPAAQWMQLLETFGPAVRRRFRSIYGQDETVLQHRRQAMLQVLRLFARRYSRQTPCCLVRAPGQLNLMGRHIDHRGGSVNVMAIDREVLVAAAPRDDDLVRLVNTDRNRFPPKTFRVADLIGDIEWGDWLSYVNSPTARELIRQSPDDWSNHVKAAVVRLQQRYTDIKMRGMDCAVTGNIPTGAGLASSSALVVAAAEAAVAINRFDVTPLQLVDLCGQGEWFTGARPGTSDHAAIRFGRRGSIAHVTFFPFEVSRIVQLPANAVVVVADSHQKPAPDAQARISQRFAAYDLAILLLRHHFPQYSHLLEYPRDIHPDRLGLPLSQIYRMLLAVPEQMTRSQLRQMLNRPYHDQLEQIFASHPEPPYYPLRSLIFYAASECARSRLAPDLLQAADLQQFGLLMRISHAGDRVSPPPSLPPQLQGQIAQPAASAGAARAPQPSDSPLPRDPADPFRPCPWSPTDHYVHARITDLSSEAPQKVTQAQFHMLPGRYAASTPQIDRMVDIACALDGVFGAQLAGAGLGGCIMALVRPDALPALRRALQNGYYRPANLACSLTVCTPVEGAGLFYL